MRTFDAFVEEQAREGSINPLVESAMYRITGDLQRIVEVLRHAKAPFEVVGGVAVNAHLMACRQRAQTFVTRDVDLLVQRSELEKIVQAARAAGYQDRRIVGGYMLLLPGQQPAEAVHLVFSGEKSHSSNLVPHPPVRPEHKSFFGLSIPVAALQDLLQMKLNSFRLKDRVHVGVLDSCGLITPQIEQQLSPAFRERLSATRQELAKEQPDVDNP